MTDTATTEATAETAAATAAQAAEGTASAAAAAPWHADPRFDAFRDTLTAKGLTAIADPVEAAARLLDMQVNAEKKLGRPASELIPRPAKDQDLAAWMKENRDLFGIPEGPEGYEVKPPEGWPKDAQWDTALESEARKIAHEEGLSGKALQRMTDAYAGAVTRLVQGAEAQVAQARTEMMAQLEKDWGGQVEARLIRARQAAGVVGERLGLDSDGIRSLTQTISANTGDASVIRLFDLIGDLTGGDSAVGVGKGNSGLGMTPAEAAARRAELMKDGSEYFIAVQRGDRAALARLRPELDRLARIAAGNS